MRVNEIANLTGRTSGAISLAAKSIGEKVAADPVLQHRLQQLSARISAVAHSNKTLD